MNHWTVDESSVAACLIALYLDSVCNEPLAEHNADEGLTSSEELQSSVCKNGLPANLHRFFDAYNGSQGCWSAAIALIACVQVKELTTRFFRSFRATFQIETTSDILLLIARSYKNRFLMISTRDEYKNLYPVSPFFRYNTKAFASADIIAKAYEGLRNIGCEIPIRSIKSPSPPTWYITLLSVSEGKEPDAISYYRAIDDNSQILSNQDYVWDEDVVTAIAIRAELGRPIDNWKLGAKIMSKTSVTKVTTIRGLVRTKVDTYRAAYFSHQEAEKREVQRRRIADIMGATQLPVAPFDNMP